MHLSFGLVDGVTVVSLSYLAADRPAELNKDSIYEDVCHVLPHEFL